MRILAMEGHKHEKEKFLIILLFITLTFIGCGNSDESNAKKIAEQFGNNLHNVNAEQVTEYNSILLNTKIEDLKKASDTIQSLHKSIKPLMTAKEYKVLLANRNYITYLTACVENNSTMRITNLTLTKTFYDKEQNTIGYNYEAKLKLISNKDKKEETAVETGYIGLSKDNGNWKVYSYKLFTCSNLLMAK